MKGMAIHHEFTVTHHAMLQKKMQLLPCPPQTMAGTCGSAEIPPDAENSPLMGRFATKGSEIQRPCNMLSEYIQF